MALDNQIAFMEVNGNYVFFNEAEAVAAITTYDEDEPVKQKPKKQNKNVPWLFPTCQRLKFLIK